MPSFRELTGNLKFCDDISEEIAKSGTLHIDIENQQLILHDGVTSGGIVLASAASAEQPQFLLLSGGTLTGPLTINSNALVAGNLKVGSGNNNLTITPGANASDPILFTKSGTGDVVFSNGDLTVQDDLEIHGGANGANPAILLLVSNSASQIGGYRYNQIRWRLQMPNVNAEGSGSTGSDFDISRYANNGTFIDTPMTLSRADASATFLGPVYLKGPVKLSSTVGFNNVAPIAKPTVSGSRSANAALASLLTQLAAYGLITDSSTV